MPSRPFFRKVDLGVGLFIIVLALVFFLVSRQEETAAYANVYLDGALLQTVSLTEDAVFTLEEAPGVTLQVENCQIRFASSDCPDQLCVDAGYLASPGQYAVCLPHRLMVQIASSAAPSADRITGNYDFPERRGV